MYTCNRCNSVTGILFSKVFYYHLFQHNILMTDLKVDSEMSVRILLEGSSHVGSINKVRVAFDK